MGIYNYCRSKVIKNLDYCRNNSEEVAEIVIEKAVSALCYILLSKLEKGDDNVNCKSNNETIYLDDSIDEKRSYVWKVDKFSVKGHIRHNHNGTISEVSSYEKSPKKNE